MLRRLANLTSTFFPLDTAPFLSSQLPRASVRSPRPFGVVRQSRSLRRGPSRSDTRRDSCSAGTNLAFDSHDYRKVSAHTLPKL